MSRDGIKRIQFNRSCVVIPIASFIVFMLLIAISYTLYGTKVVYGSSIFDNCLFIGDSRYVLYGATSKLEALGSNVAVRAVSGSTVEQWQDTVKNGSGTVHGTNITLPATASCVSVMLGANSPHQISQMKDVMQSLHSRYPNAKIVFNSIYHLGSNWVYGYNESIDANKSYDSFNNDMKYFCNTNSGWAAYVDITSGIHDANGFLKHEYADESGIHLTYDGVAVLVNNIKNEVGKVISGSSSTVQDPVTNPEEEYKDKNVEVPETARRETCYYMTNKFKAKLVVHTGKPYAGRSNTNNIYTDVYVNKLGDSPQNNFESVLNWIEGSWTSHTTTGTNPVVFKDLYEGERDAAANGTCPKYLVIQDCRTYKIWGTNIEGTANNAYNAINSDPKCVGHVATFKNSEGVKITEDEYYGSFVHKTIEGNEIDELECYGENSLFGEKNDEGIKKSDGTVVKPPSLAYMINSVLKYVRILVPILIILLGTLDLAKAVIASDEEKMRKAQKDFLKRIILGVIIFFIPTLINLIMNVADTLWESAGYNDPCLLP